MEGGPCWLHGPDDEQKSRPSGKDLGKTRVLPWTAVVQASRGKICKLNPANWLHSLRFAASARCAAHATSARAARTRTRTTTRRTTTRRTTTTSDEDDDDESDEDTGESDCGAQDWTRTATIENTEHTRCSNPKQKYEPQPKKNNRAPVQQQQPSSRPSLPGPVPTAAPLAAAAAAAAAAASASLHHRPLPLRTFRRRHEPPPPPPPLSGVRGAPAVPAQRRCFRARWQAFLALKQRLCAGTSTPQRKTGAAVFLARPLRDRPAVERRAEPGGSACCYWNGCGTQRNHPAQGLVQRKG